ncbi:hypothetical protein GCM10027346_28280 [Hymenobacter seoulensis]
MLFFPRITEAFYSPLSPTEIQERLQDNLADPITWRSLFIGQPSAFFRGSASTDTFKLQRNISYRNSWLPQITGWVTLQPDGTCSVVRVCHRLSHFVLAFNLVWLAFVSIGLLMSLSSWSSNKEAMLIPLGMLISGLALFTLPFWFEVSKSRPLLVELLELEEAGIARQSVVK